MASIFDVATVERVRGAYASTGAVPKRGVAVERDRLSGVIYACPIGVLALDVEPSLVDGEPETSYAMEIAGIDDDASAEGFRNGFDDADADDEYVPSEDQVNYDLGYMYGEGMRVELGL